MIFSYHSQQIFLIFLYSKKGATLVCPQELWFLHLHRYFRLNAVPNAFNLLHKNWRQPEQQICIKKRQQGGKAWYRRGQRVKSNGYGKKESLRRGTAGFTQPMESFPHLLFDWNRVSVGVRSEIHYFCYEPNGFFDN